MVKKESRNIGCTCNHEVCRCRCRCRTCRHIREEWTPPVTEDGSRSWSCVGVIAVFAVPVLYLFVLAWAF